MKTIDLDIVSVDIHEGPLGINVSGGADSAILLYILMSNMAKGTPLHVFNCCSKQKHRRSAHHALDVVAKCMDLTEKENVSIHVNMVDRQTGSALLALPMHMLETNEIRYFYTGLTCLPPTSVFESFKNETTFLHERDPNKINKTYVETDGRIYKPFANIDKKGIQFLYKKFLRLEDLYPLTRSCESLTLMSGHCGECWWCEERLWAFGSYE